MIFFSIATAPIRVVEPLVREVTSPLAEAAEEVVESVKEFTGK